MLNNTQSYPPFAYHHSCLLWSISAFFINLMMLENGPDLSVNTLFDAFLQDSQILQYWSHIAVFLHIIPHSPVLARMKPLYECFPCQFLSISNFKMKMSTNAITVSEYMARHWFRIFERYTSILYIKMYPIIIFHSSDVSLRESAIPINMIKDWQYGKGLVAWWNPSSLSVN